MYNYGPSIIIAQWVLFGGACGAVAIRYGACRRPQYGFWWDDLVVSVALILFCATCVTGTLACAWGVGKFVPDVNPSTLAQSTLFGIISTDLGMLADSVSKVAVVLLIIRLFCPRIWMKWAMITCTLLNVVFNILLVIFSFVQCTPQKFQWNRTTMTGKCWSIDVFVDFAYFTGSWTAFLDIFFSIYPLFVVSQLKMKWRKKLAVMATMSFGFGTFAVTTYKVATQYPLFKDGATDATRILGSVMFWNAVGVAFTIIAGSIPTWGWLFRTTPWRNTIHFLSGRRIGGSRRTSNSTVEKFPFAANSNRTTPADSRQLTPSPSRLPSGDEMPIVFPERSHSASQSERCVLPQAPPTVPRISRASRMPSRPFSLTRGGPMPMDSLQQLERSTWRS